MARRGLKRSARRSVVRSVVLRGRYSHTAQKVINFLGVLTGGEKDAIASFVDSQEAIGQWTGVATHMFLFSLTNVTAALTDWVTGNTVSVTGSPTKLTSGYFFDDAGESIDLGFTPPASDAEMFWSTNTGGAAGVTTDGGLFAADNKWHMRREGAVGSGVADGAIGHADGIPHTSGQDLRRYALYTGWRANTGGSGANTLFRGTLLDGVDVAAYTVGSTNVEINKTANSGQIVGHYADGVGDFKLLNWVTEMQNLLSATGSPTYREESIYSATKTVTTSWQTEKLATAVNAIWIHNTEGADIEIGWGATPALASSSQVTVAAGIAGVFLVSGEYVGWTSLSSVSMTLEQSKIA